MYDAYIVQEGDTLDTISKKLKTSPEILQNLNGYDINLTEGNIIIVPKTNSQYFNYYKVVKGDTLYKIATENNINPDLLAMLNGINKADYIYPNQVLLIPKAGSSLYITAEGDTLMEVAKGFKIKPEDLIKQNKNIYLQAEQLIVYKYK